MKRVLTAVLLAGLGGTAAADLKLTGDNTVVEWTGTKPGGKHSGGFKTVTGSITGSEPTAAVIDVTFETDSITSDDPKLTEHLKTPHFFDVKTFKTAGFKSTKVVKDGDKHTVTGDLTICGKTKRISFPAEFTAAGGKLGLKAEFSIDRTDYGMTYGKGKIDDKVALKVTVDPK